MRRWAPGTCGLCGHIRKWHELPGPACLNTGDIRCRCTAFVEVKYVTTNPLDFDAKHLGADPREGGRESWMLPNGPGLGSRPLHNVHPRAQCEPGACPIHNPSDHLMRIWPMHYREDIGVMERTCPCGTGHPDPDDPHNEGRMHGCCACHQNLILSIAEGDEIEPLGAVARVTQEDIERNLHCVCGLKLDEHVQATYRNLDGTTNVHGSTRCARYRRPSTLDEAPAEEIEEARLANLKRTQPQRDRLAGYVVGSYPHDPSGPELAHRQFDREERERERWAGDLLRGILDPNKERPNDATFEIVCADELRHAREKFPTTEGCLAALMEEVGKLAQALLDKPWDEVVKEATQVVTCAQRIAVEGDPTLTDLRTARGAK